MPPPQTEDMYPLKLRTVGSSQPMRITVTAPNQGAGSPQAVSDQGAGDRRENVSLGTDRPGALLYTALMPERTLAYVQHHHLPPAPAVGGGGGGSFIESREEQQWQELP